MSKYHAQALELARDLNASLSRIAGHRDPNLTKEGLDQARAEATAELRKLVAPRIDELSRYAKARAGMARLGADVARPKIGDDAAALIRAQQKWEQARGLLESGRDIRVVIAAADMDMLLAIEEFAPTYLQSKMPAPSAMDKHYGDTDEAVDIGAFVEARMVEIAPKEVATKLREAREAEQDLAAATPYIEHVSEYVQYGSTRSTMLELAIASKISGAVPSLPAEPSAQSGGTAA